MSGLSVALSAIGLLAEPRTDIGMLFRAETAAGMAPISPGERAEKAIALTLDATPNLQVEGTRSTFRLELGSRFYFRRPHLGDLERPLILGHLLLTHRYSLDRRTRWLTDASGTVGEVDYANTQLSLAPGTGSQLTVPVLASAQFQGSSGVERDVAKTHSIRVEGVVAHSESMGRQVGLLPTTTTVGGDVAWRWLVSPRTSVLLPIQGKYYFAEPGLDLFATSVGVLVTRELDRGSSLELGAGVARVDVFAEGQSTFPRARVAWRQRIATRRNLEVRSELAGGLEAVYDTTRAEMLPVAAVQSTTTATWSQRWAARLSVAAYTQVGAVKPAEEAATSFSADAIIDRQLSDAIDLMAGARYFTRASDFRADHFQVIDRQGWLFIGLRANLETRVARREPQVF